MGNSKWSKNEAAVLGMPQRERQLHLAVMGNERETVRNLILEGADINYPWSNPTVPSVKDSTTPLLAAVSLNHVDITMVSISDTVVDDYDNDCDGGGGSGWQAGGSG